MDFEESISYNQLSTTELALLRKGQHNLPFLSLL